MNYLAFQKASLEAQQSRIDAFRSRKIVVSNYFGAQSADGELWESDACLFLRIPEAEHYRLFVLSTDPSALAAALARLPSATYVANIPTRTVPGALATHLENSGFTRIADYRRMAQRQIPTPSAPRIPSFATSADFTAIRTLIDAHFSPYTDYPPSDECLGQMIAENRVIVAREGATVCAAIAFTCMGNKAYLNIWVARRHGMDVLRDFYAHLAHNQWNLSFWVRADNTRAIERYVSMGAQFDGMRDYSYLKCAKASVV